VKELIETIIIYSYLVNTKEKFLIKKLSLAVESNDTIIVIIIPYEYQEFFLNPKIFMSGKIN
jgi:hypothetical protein